MSALIEQRRAASQIRFHRTAPETRALISSDYHLSAANGICADEIESAYGTKQFYFEARRPK